MLDRLAHILRATGRVGAYVVLGLNAIGSVALGIYCFCISLGDGFFGALGQGFLGLIGPSMLGLVAICLTGLLWVVIVGTAHSVLWLNREVIEPLAEELQ